MALRDDDMASSIRPYVSFVYGRYLMENMP